MAGPGVRRPFEWPPYDSGEHQKLAVWRLTTERDDRHGRGLSCKDTKRPEDDIDLHVHYGTAS